MKKLISLLLALVLLCFSTVTVFAIEKVNYRQIMELEFYIDDVQDVYGIYSDAGNVYIRYTDETFMKLWNDIDSVNKMTEEYYMGVSITQTMIDDAYALIGTDIENLRVEKFELEFLIDYCNKETNENGYYPDDVWNDLQVVLNTASVIFSENSDDTEITNIYWELRAVYNKLCICNQTMGDINGDGIVSILDATLLSESLVERFELNSSQKLVSTLTSDINNISIEDVAAIQKYLVGNSERSFNTPYFNAYYNLNMISDNIYSHDLTTNCLFHSAIYHRYFGGSL